jgi:hypothetical protein
MPADESKPCRIRELKEHYLLIPQSKVLKVLGTAIGTFLLGIVGVVLFSREAAKDAINSVLASTEAKVAADRIIDTDKKVRGLLAGLESRQAKSAGFNSVESDHKRVLGTNRPERLPLPHGIPEAATEILVFCFAKSEAVKDKGAGFLDVSTTDANNRTTTLRLYVRAYPQQAAAFNSDYFWLPYPKDRVVAAQWSGILPTEETAGYVQVVGFR